MYTKKEKFLNTFKYLLSYHILLKYKSPLFSGDFSDRGWSRTIDPLLKRQMLYR